jgi:perosamine synthetase
MQAAMGLVQLGKLKGIVETKRSNARWMSSRLGHLSSIRLPAELPSRKHVYMLYTILLERNRDGVLQALLENGIEARVYFPPAHLQPVFAGGPSLPMTEDLAERILSLPFHSQLTRNEFEEIAVTLECSLARFDLL